MVELPLSELVDAGTILMRAARWDDADRLLTAAETEHPAERAIVAITVAEIAVDQDFAQGSDTAGPALESAETALSEAPDPTLSWDLEFLKLRKDYGTALFAADHELHFGPDGRDPGVGEALAKRAEQLRLSALTDERTGHAAFYAGLIADNVRGLSAEAFASYTSALELGERSGDNLLESLALRHLGDHAHTVGDLVLARTQWERSTELRQKIGHLLGALAQQALLAVLARDEGNPAASAALATEVHRWSRQLNLDFLEAQAAELMNPSGESGPGRPTPGEPGQAESLVTK
jgi:hypothetical protein